jgi:hypothetical protein
MKKTDYRIAVLSATPRHLNTGMLCVDLSIKLLLQKIGLSEKVEYFCFDLPDKLREELSNCYYRPLKEMPPYKDFDLIIIWGDFIVTKKWIHQISNVLVKAGDFEFEEAKKEVEYRVLLKGCEDNIYLKTIIFGQSLMVDDAAIFEDKLYLNAFKKLLQKAKFVRFRDPLSAYRATFISGNCNANFLGVDAAFLLSELYEENQEVNQTQNNDEIGIFLYRTNNAKLTKLILGTLLRKHFSDYTIRWIPWLQELKEPTVGVRRAFRIKDDYNQQKFPEIINLLKRFNFIIADTYHIVLVSWALGVPAVCLGNGLQPFQRTLDDKKKELLYSQNYLSDYYIYNESTYKNILNGEIIKILKTAENSNRGNFIRSKMKEISKEYIQIFKEQIESILFYDDRSKSNRT